MAIRRANAGDRELEEIRTGLARVSRANRCVFVAAGPSEPAQPSAPPAQLIYILASLWPEAKMDFAASWDETTAQRRAAHGDQVPVSVYVAWSPRGRVRGTAPVADLKAMALPFHYRDLEIVAYARDPLPLAAVE
jgi:hypothetical protein